MLTTTILMTLLPAAAPVPAFQDPQAEPPAAQSQGEVAARDVEVRPVLPGMKAPDCKVRDLEGRPVALKDVYADGPVVLVFYRGGW